MTYHGCGICQYFHTRENQTGNAVKLNVHAEFKGFRDVQIDTRRATSYAEFNAWIESCTMIQLSPDIEAKVRANFKNEEVGAVLSALSEMIEPPFEGEWALTRERVQIAILVSAQSSLERMLQSVAGAQIDWRDTLVGAGLGESNWRSVAKEAGYDVE